MMQTDNTTLAQEASLVSSTGRGSRSIVVESPQTLGLIGLLGLGLLLLSGLPI